MNLIAGLLLISATGSGVYAMLRYRDKKSRADVEREEAAMQPHGDVVVPPPMAGKVIHPGLGRPLSSRDGNAR